MLDKVDDAVWKALADPTRRRMVETLSTRSLRTGELVDLFAPQLVRTAVMKHLDVLAEAGLLNVSREGRIRWNALEKAPLAKVSTWLKRRVLTHQANLQRLKKIVESSAGDTSK